MQPLGWAGQQFAVTRARAASQLFPRTCLSCCAGCRATSLTRRCPSRAPTWSPRQVRVLICLPALIVIVCLQALVLIGLPAGGHLLASCYACLPPQGAAPGSPALARGCAGACGSNLTCSSATLHDCQNMPQACINAHVQRRAWLLPAPDQPRTLFLLPACRRVPMQECRRAQSR